MGKQPLALEEIRENIDSLDRDIIGLISQRQKWVVEAGKLKKNEDGVRAPARVEQVIEKARNIAVEKESNPDVVEKTYRAMIAAFIEFELKIHRGRSQNDCPY